MKLSVVGLGKLGAPLAAVFASKGFDVIGTDLNALHVEDIRAGRAPVDEPMLQQLIDASRTRLSATHDVAEAVAASDVTFVIVPTPSDLTGRFSNAAVVDAMTGVGAGVRRKNDYHLVVVTSTVMPGSTGGEIRAALERHSGREVGPTLGLCYNPEFIALGSVVRDMLQPDMILIGESDQHAGDLLEQIYVRGCDNRPPVRHMNFVNAELAKISVNTFVTTKISYANMLADICDRLPGADVDVVTQAIGCDTRIGAKYLKGAIGYGGPCFPRDNVAFSVLARSIGARAELAEATDALNRYQVERVLGAVEARAHDSGVIGVLGLAYKPDTAVVEESQGMALVARLLDLGHQVVAYDPKAMAAARLVLRRPFETAATAADCVRAASLVVVMTPWPEFRELGDDVFCRVGSRLTVIDCWRVIPKTVAAVAHVVYLGYGGTAQSEPVRA
ncbi:MAG TPA: nucleotide sugar dehydrogenase [Vicinamibacterales bacterium]|jgi:UDPglucose 6-dehydrogenase